MVQAEVSHRDHELISELLPEPGTRPDAETDLCACGCRKRHNYAVARTEGVPIAGRKAWRITWYRDAHHHSKHLKRMTT